jgi:hypothetical protein
MTYSDAGEWADSAQPSTRRLAYEEVQALVNYPDAILSESEQTARRLDQIHKRMARIERWIGAGVAILVVLAVVETLRWLPR